MNCGLAFEIFISLLYGYYRRVYEGSIHVLFCYVFVENVAICTVAVKRLQLSVYLTRKITSVSRDLHY